MAFAFAVIAVAGMLQAFFIAKRMPVARLRQGFAFMFIITGSFVLWQSWMK